MPEVELARREGVELIRVGSWRILSGDWEPNRKDILAAVEAFQCPAVRRPRIKIGHLDPRFNKPEPGPQFDGQPSLGWFDNLRAGEDGDVLIADQLALPWFNQVQAAAFPDRSVEGTYGMRCALGHRHPFVITAVSMLGETPPGIPTLKSIEDLPQFLGVAAAGDPLDEGQAVEVTVRAAAEVHTGAMVALIPTVEDAARLAVDGGEPAEQLHVTLRYLGRADQLPDRARARIVEAVSRAVASLPPFDADGFYVAAFNPGREDRDPCVTLGVSGTLVEAAQELATMAVEDVAAELTLDLPAPHRPFHAHLTLGYTADLDKVKEWSDRVGPVRFDRVRVAFGGATTDIPLVAIDQAELLVPNILLPVAAAAGDSLRNHWVRGEGATEIRWGTPGDFGRCVQKLRQHVRDPEGLCAEYHHDATGMWPGDKRNVRASQVVDTADAAPTETPPPDNPDPGPAPAPTEPLKPPTEAASSFLPAAEPEPETPNPDPKEEDPVSTTDLSPIGSRLGLDGDVTMDSITEAIDALKAKADTPPPAPEPTPEMVAASAAATEKAAELEKTVEKLAGQLAAISTELAAAKQEKADTVKASVLGEAQRLGKFPPADKEQWERDYDEAPGVTTRILASIAPGTAVPVAAAGVTGPAEPEVSDGFDVSSDALSVWASQLGIDAEELTRG